MSLSSIYNCSLASFRKHDMSFAGVFVWFCRLADKVQYQDFLKCLNLFAQDICSRNELSAAIHDVLGRFPDLTVRGFQYIQSSNVFISLTCAWQSETVTPTDFSSITEYNLDVVPICVLGCSARIPVFVCQKPQIRRLRHWDIQSCRKPG